MRASLESLGRFDPVRARARLADGFSASCTSHVVVNGERVGFVVLRPHDDHLLLDHLYFWPSHQGKGYGSQVLAQVFAQADAQGKPVRVGSLKGSRSNDFYRRHGFQLVGAGEWDNYYVRAPLGPA